jgi:fumarate hydratase class II
MGYRKEKDSLGFVEVPDSSLWGAQTQRAIDNFPISGQRFSRQFVAALAHLKRACAEVNLRHARANAIRPHWDEEMLREELGR